MFFLLLEKNPRDKLANSWSQIKNILILLNIYILLSVNLLVFSQRSTQLFLIITARNFLVYIRSLVLIIFVCICAFESVLTPGNAWKVPAVFLVRFWNGFPLPISKDWERMAQGYLPIADSWFLDWFLNRYTKVALVQVF